MKATRLGMSIVEALISLLIVGMMAVSGLAAAGHASRMRTIGHDRSESQRLACILLDEVMAKRAGSFIDTVEITDDRNRFTSIDEYDGYRQSPPRDTAGVALKDESWSWGVEIERCDEQGVPRDSGPLRRISVMVYRDGDLKATVRSIIGGAFARVAP